MRSIAIIVAILFAVGFIHEFVQPWLEMHEERIAIMERRLDQIEKNIANLRREFADKAELMKTRVSASETADADEPSEGDTGAITPSEGDSQNAAAVDPMSRVREAAALSVIVGIVALSNDEKESLRQIAKKSNQFEIADEEIQGILGRERFEAFATERERLETNLRAEQVEKEANSLSRSLNLTPEQQIQISGIVERSMGKFQPRRGTPEWDALPSSPEERIRYRILQEEARQEFILEESRPILSEEQLNKLLEERANSFSHRSHESFLQSLEGPDKSEETRAP